MKHLSFLSLLLAIISSQAQQTTALTVREVYDFEIGDVYQYQSTTYNHQGYSGVTVNAHTTYTLIAKSIQANQLSYTWHRVEEAKYITGMSGGTNYKSDTIIGYYTHLDSSILFTQGSVHDTLVLPPCSYCHVDSVYNSTNYNGRFLLHHYQGDAMANGYVLYGKGLGMVKQHSMSEDFDAEQGNLELVYYRKTSGETWGDFYEINYVGVSENDNDQEPLLYFHSGIVTASLQSQPTPYTKLTIYSLTGQVLSVHLLENRLNNIHLGTLPAGMYLWHIQEAGRKMGTGKLIMQ